MVWLLFDEGRVGGRRWNDIPRRFVLFVGGVACFGMFCVGKGGAALDAGRRDKKELEHGRRRKKKRSRNRSLMTERACSLLPVCLRLTHDYVARRRRRFFA